MSYNFELIGIAPVLTFFNYQQELGTDPQRSKAYLGSYHCTLDGFIESIKMIPQKPAWDWDEVTETMIGFWLKHEAKVKHWKLELEKTSEDSLLIARVANFEALRNELESLF